MNHLIKKPNIFILPKEYRNRGILYHSTKLENLDYIVRCHEVVLKAYSRYGDEKYSSAYGISFSRCKHFNYGEYKIYGKSYYIDGGEIQFALDAQKLKNRYKLVPYNYLINDAANLDNKRELDNITGSFDIYDETEELLITNEAKSHIDIRSSLLFIRITKGDISLEDDWIISILQELVVGHNIKVYDRYFNDMTEKIKTSWEVF